jgi:hypothetical protein
MDCNGTDRENLRNKLGVLAAFLELDYRVVFDLYGVAIPTSAELTPALRACRSTGDCASRISW